MRRLTPRFELRKRSRAPRREEQPKQNKGETFKSRSAFQVDKKADNAHKATAKNNKHITKKQKERTKRRARKRATAKHSDGSSGSRETSGTNSASEGSESSGQLFQLAASSDGGKANQTRLVDWAKAHPGRLAAAQLQGMQDKVGEREAAWDVTDTPASAKSYYLRVLKMGVAQGSMRNLRKMTTLCTIQDHFALGRTRQAADTVAQRLRAVEMACADGHWEGAQHQELRSAAGCYPSDFEVGGVLGSAGAEAHGEGGREHPRRQQFRKHLEGVRQRQGRLQGEPLLVEPVVQPLGVVDPVLEPHGGKGKGQKGKPFGKSKTGKGKPPQGDTPSAGE